MSDSHPIPEEYRRRALYAALHHHDGVAGTWSPGDNWDAEGASVMVEFRPPGHPQAPEDHEPDGAREYVKRVAGALGYSFAARGPFEAKLRPDVQHALAGLQGASA